MNNATTAIDAFDLPDESQGGSNGVFYASSAADDAESSSGRQVLDFRASFQIVIFE
jgi:hypothetical protein